MGHIAFISPTPARHVEFWSFPSAENIQQLDFAGQDGEDGFDPMTPSSPVLFLPTIIHVFALKQPASVRDVVGGPVIILHSV